MRTAALDLRPIMWLATLAFALGFAGYMAVAWPHQARADRTYIPAASSGPASDAWNFEKKI